MQPSNTAECCRPRPSPVTVYTPDNSDDIMSYGDNL